MRKVISLAIVYLLSLIMQQPIVAVALNAVGQDGPVSDKTAKR